MTRSSDGFRYEPSQLTSWPSAGGHPEIKLPVASNHFRLGQPSDIRFENALGTATVRPSIDEVSFHGLVIATIFLAVAEQESEDGGLVMLDLPPLSVESTSMEPDNFEDVQYITNSTATVRRRR
ncbi:MAG: hypothetical protein K2Q28_10415 [Hyphomicrobium sp.]|nr:hypothetical protein [Hyphomicrobium sp.]